MITNIKGDIIIKEIADMIGAVVNGNPNTAINRVITDSREAGVGALFIAIKGERFDGHDYIRAAIENGASAVLAQRLPDGCENISAVIVNDTVKALGAFAKAFKERINPLTVAVTGSTGKTTTKEFIYAVLSEKYKTLKTTGNHNNEIGLPMCLLGIDETYNAAVIEMGMSNSGEIDYLSRIACPKIAVITNIGSSHIENLGSREAIRNAKLEIRSGMSHYGVLILNADEPLLSGIDDAFYVGFDNPDADIRIFNVIEGENGCAFDLDVKGEIVESIVIPALGKHNVYDASLAYAVGIHAGLGEFEIRRGLKNFKTTGMRQNIYEKTGKVVMEDCYNAAPESVIASLKVFSDMADRKGMRKVAVLGDMLELGDYTEEGHIRVGAAVVANGIDLLFTFGNKAAIIAESAHSFGMERENIKSFIDINDIDALGKALEELTCENDAILFKASRSVKLERALEYVK